MIYSRSPQIAWREPFRARARAAREDFRRRWYLLIGAGAALTLTGLTLLAFWAYSLNEPLNVRATVLVCGAGLLVALGLTLDRFIPRAIKLGERSIRIAYSSYLEWIRYPDLRRCDLTPGPDPQFRGFGKATEPLFAILWDPDLDPELLRAFLLAKGITFSAAPPDPYQAPGRPSPAERLRT